MDICKQGQKGPWILCTKQDTKQHQKEIATTFTRIRGYDEKTFWLMGRKQWSGLPSELYLYCRCAGFKSGILLRVRSLLYNHYVKIF